jgi:hypothetical protein
LCAFVLTPTPVKNKLRRRDLRTSKLDGKALLTTARHLIQAKVRPLVSHHHIRPRADKLKNGVIPEKVIPDKKEEKGSGGRGGGTDVTKVSKVVSKISKVSKVSKWAVVKKAYVPKTHRIPVFEGVWQHVNELAATLSLSPKEVAEALGLREHLKIEH